MVRASGNNESRKDKL